MFDRLGDWIPRFKLLIIGLWMTAFVGLHYAAPPFNSLAQGGTFVFLPDKMASRQSEELLERAFPGRKTTSSIVIVVFREGTGVLNDDDRTFIDQRLKPDLEKLRDQLNGSARLVSQRPTPTDGEKPDLIRKIHTFSDHGIGALLVSSNATAMLVTIDLATDFQDSANWNVVSKVEALLHHLSSSSDFPKDLKLAMTGSATLGRDISTAETYIAQNTGSMTIGIVVILLLVIYRAPLLALVPLLTLIIAVDVSLNLLTTLAAAGIVPLFKGLREYTTVLTYGPGVDYCLFLIARYKENLQQSLSTTKALSLAIGQVGATITASAATVICGIGMLSFADFGKFHEAGIGISIALLVTLVATLTLTPALLSLMGHWVFWPKPGVHADRHEPQSSRVQDDQIVQPPQFEAIWTHMGNVIQRRPVRILTVTASCMIPFMMIGLVTYDGVNYGLLETLPHSAPSQMGAAILRNNFPAGVIGPVQIILENPKVDFRTADGIDMVHDLGQRLMKRRDELQIFDIRSVSDPLGMRPTEASDDNSDLPIVQKAIQRNALRRHSINHYVSSAPLIAGHVTVVDVILSTTPFSMESTRSLNLLSSAIQEGISSDLKDTTRVSFVGPTASVRDLAIINRSDQRRIFLLVLLSVFLILVALLRSISVSLYLLLTVLFSFVSTLGVTWLAFYWLDPNEFNGLDWTVPVFLFVVMIAVGEDYNIFLVARIREEQKQYGPLPGILIALSRTGGIITSCGFIMAGTFTSLCFCTLLRMQQLGFALAFGVLLDTFIIRPIIVPSFLVILNDHRYGNLIRYFK